MKSRKPVWWEKIPFINQLVVKAIPLSGKPALVISLPRSGSSWIGRILGGAPNATYLREPLTQSNLALGASSTVFYVDPQLPPHSYTQFADYAFTGLPAFSTGIVQTPSQWSLLSRINKRLVLKEVNPLALAWLCETYRPRIIYLVRHPAAVALSYWRLGWRNAEQRLNELPSS